MNRNRIVGLISLIVVVAVVCGFAVWRTTSKPESGPSRSAVSVTGYLGGEKTGLFDDSQFTRLAADAGLKVDYRKAGSLDMMMADRAGMDYLFPSSRTAVEYGASKGVKAARQDIVFNSPIVVYTHKSVAEGLAKSGIMHRDGDVWRLDMAKAVDAMKAGRTWAQVGYAGGYGVFHIESTDPVKSNSGNEYAALLANTMNGGQPATRATVKRDAPTIRSIFAKSGWMETSSEDSFNQFLTLGVGSKPMMVGYESQILDLAVNNPDAWAQVKDDLVIAYPTPTVWSTHTFMALDAKGEKLLTLLESKPVQKLAWERHGFRSVDFSGTDSITRFGVPGTVDTVQNVTELPPNDAMQDLIEALRH
ncbi:hypothetical protein CS006_00665 [Bifidobacterium primatium]|uniref:Bacterial extracellular solute-binding protein n=1 Tax=Bifidobacterium primatium TaxID=2045438 RepID=A0A2M9HA91_9BIFI|nr:substrate-binding domain-containing protein [Bifidobacterium primatium]PJM73736.1 hypothetical protein CS006_00665 [Bifidobacterium primatium]